MKNVFIAISLLGGVYGAEAQQTKAFNQNASRSNHTRLGLMNNDDNFTLRLTGGVTKSRSEKMDPSSVFIPGIAAHYYTGNIGIGVEAGGFSSLPDFNLNDYTKNIRSFTTTDIRSTEWRNWFVLAGPSFRKGFGGAGASGYPFQLSVDLHGGIVKMQPASFSVKDKQDGTFIADYYGENKQGTDIERQSFAVKPTIRFEWFPQGKAIGFNVHAALLQVMSAKEITTYYRDLSKVQYNMPQSEVRYQVMNAPVVENRTKGPISNYSFGAGVSIRIPTSNKGITEKGVSRGKPSAGKRVAPTTEKSINEKGVRGNRRVATGAPDEMTIPASNKGITEKGVSANKRSIAQDADDIMLPTTEKSINEKGIKRTEMQALEQQDIVSPRDVHSGLPSGRRLTDNSGSQSCGPVTQRVLQTDGSIVETTFTCPLDAAMYQQLISSPTSDNIATTTVARQTPNTSFGEKVNAGLHAAGSALASGASREKIYSGDVAVSILAEADTDGDGVYDTDVTAQVKDEVVLNGDEDTAQPSQKAGISTSRSNVRTRSALQYKGDGLFVSYTTAMIDGKETPVKSVLKTKHDTAKNSVGNIR